MSDGCAADLIAAFGPERVRRRVSLAPLTTFRVGGPADLYVEPRSSTELLAALQIAHSHGLPVTILGGGSNVLIADAGIRGLVLRPRGGGIIALDPEHISADASVTINGLVRWTIMRGVAGLEAWAGTPGTVGGAVVGNAHFAGRLIGDLVSSVRLAARDGAIVEVPAASMGFGYDRSRVQETGEVVLAVTFRVGGGDPSELRAIARQSLAYRKSTQPLDSQSAGCIFRNPEPGRDVVPAGVPWSAGALIDRAGLKGAVCGGARVSTAHGNFIVNDGAASAAEIRALIERCRTEVRRIFGVELREEIVYIGEW